MVGKGWILIPLLIAVCLMVPRIAWAQDPSVEPPVGRVDGLVTNLTAGGQLPVNVPVVLYVLQDFEPVEVITGTVSSDGSFALQDVPLLEGHTYLATLEYQGVAYGSTFAEYAGVGDVLALDIDVYETISDPAVIQISRLHVIVEFAGGQMHVSELYILSNLSDRVFVGPTGVAQGGTIEIPLPPGAVEPTLERSVGEAMVPTSSSAITTESGYRDTLPVRPGSASQQLMLSFSLPYAGQAAVSHTLPYATQSISLFVPDAGLEVESELLQATGRQPSEGMPFLQWDAADLPAGTLLGFRVSGDAAAAATLEPSAVSETQAERFPLSVEAGDNLTTYAVGTVGLVLALAIVGYVRFRRQPASTGGRREALLLALLDLDADREAGRIPTAQYELAREQIRAELSAWYQR